MKISDFYKTDGINYASYDNYRKISSFIDGLKSSYRKCLYTVLKNNINTPKKVEQLQSLTAEQTQYIHGAQSLGGVIVSMAQDFIGTNNVPFFKREGSFGTRLIPVAAAGRYIFTCKEDYLDLIYKKDDIPILTEQNFEGSVIEPKFYVPVIPMLAVNGALGLTTGFQQKIMCRNPKDCIKYIKAKLNGEKLPEVNPWYRGFTGDIQKNKDKDNSWLVMGKYRQIAGNKIEITEVPIDYTLESYKDILDTLEENKDIKEYQDLSENGRFHFIVTLWRNEDKGFDINDKQLLSKLKLISSITENFTSLDENNKVVECKSIYDILDRYYDIRLEYYKKRKEYQISALTEKIVEMVSRYLFIKNVVEEKIIISNRSDEDIISQISGIKNIIKIDDSFDYLLNMNIRSLTKSKYEALLSQIKLMKAKLDELKEISLKEMWIKDLDELQEKLTLK